MTITAQEYDGPVAMYTDPLTGQKMYSTCLTSYAEERLLSARRFYLELYLFRMKEDGADKYLMRSIIRNSPAEWPLSSAAYLLVDDLRFPLELEFINPRTLTTVSGSGIDGDTSVSSSESQLYRVESVLSSEAIEAMTLTSEVSLIIYSGNFPVTFKVTKGELYRVLKQRDLRLN